MRQPLGLPVDALSGAPGSRRHVLGLALGLAGSALVPGSGRAAAVKGGSASAAQGVPQQHFPFGAVIPPRTLPDWPVLTHQGQAGTLPALLRGRVTALQLMFTGCSATCPLQGALFAQARQALSPLPGPAQFLSLSIAPLSDTPQALAAWLRQFSSEAGWLAAAPRVQDVDAVLQVLGAGGETRPTGRDPHTGQVYLIDRRGALVWRTVSMPPAPVIVAQMRAWLARA